MSESGSDGSGVEPRLRRQGSNAKPNQGRHRAPDDPKLSIFFVLVPAKLMRYLLVWVVPFKATKIACQSPKELQNGSPGMAVHGWQRL